MKPTGRIKMEWTHMSCHTGVWHGMSKDLIHTDKWGAYKAVIFEATWSGIGCYLALYDCNDPKNPKAVFSRKFYKTSGAAKRGAERHAWRNMYKTHYNKWTSMIEGTLSLWRKEIRKHE